MVLPEACADCAERRAGFRGFEQLTEALARESFLQASFDARQSFLITVRAAIAGVAGDEDMRIAAQIDRHRTTPDAIANSF